MSAEVLDPLICTCRCWEINPGPHQEQVHLTTELSLAPEIVIYASLKALRWRAIEEHAQVYITHACHTHQKPV